MHDVHWNEGMLLLPQHLQLFRSHMLERAARAAMQRVGVGAYGVRVLEWNLSPETLSVGSVDLTLPCGTVVRVPDECSVESVSISDALSASRGAIDVWLGVPEAREGVSVVASDDNRAGRYRIQRVAVRDEVDASPRSQRDVLVRKLNARLFVGEMDRAGHSCIRVARVSRRSEHETEPVLDRNFVPPLLDVTADPGLRKKLRELCDDLRQKNESLGRHVSSQPFALALQTGADPEQIFKLDALNTQLGAIEQLCLTKGVHPFDTYLALCRLAGSLALFGPDRVCPAFPAYEHDRLEVCFEAVINKVKVYLASTIREHYERRDFVSDARGVQQCRLAPEWLQPGSELYLGTMSESVEPEDLDRLVGQIVKLFGARDEALRLMVPGIRLQRQVRVPPALPNRHNGHYFRLDRESTPTARWAALASSEIAELKFEGDVPTDVKFEMFIVPRR